MSRRSSSRRHRGERPEVRAAAAPTAPPPAAEPAPKFAALWLCLAALVPSLNTLTGAFLYDDLPVIVQNARLHGLAKMPEIWTHGYWPDRPGLTLYRPVTQTLWNLLWVAGGGQPWLFHVVNLLMICGVVVLAFQVLQSMNVSGRTAFLAALLFAVLPIHTEATAAIIGGSELLAAVFGLGALWLYRRGAHGRALGLYLLAVFSKESASALAGIALLGPWLESGPRPRVKFGRLALHAAVVAGVVGLALLARSAVMSGLEFVPPIDNPMSLVNGPRRVLTALWVQCLYVAKTVVPLQLSADYSYRQIPLVMGLQDPRAWAGLALAALATWVLLRRPGARLGLAWWIVPFLPTANLLLPIGTMMGERLAFLPSLGLVLLLVQAGERRRWLPVAVAVVAVVFAFRTAVRNTVWHDADEFYPRLVETSPDSAKTHYFLGCLKAARDDPAGALAEYDRAIAIFRPYPEALNNRGCILVQLGRLEEAKASFRDCLRFDPGHAAAAASLQCLENGIPFEPHKPKI